MRIVEHSDVNAFRDRAMPLLMRDECANCVLIGVLGRLVEGKPATKSGEIVVPMLLTLEDDDGALHAIAMQTPPHAQLFTPMDEPCARALADHLHEREWTGRDFSGIEPTVRALAQRWRELKQRDFTVHISLRLFRTNRVIDPPHAPGTLRAATAQDMRIATDWIRAFGEEIREPFPDPARAAQIAIGEGRLHLWFDQSGEPRSCCAWQGPTPHSVRIGLVYTPPENRGRGYASNAVAELTRRLLASGRKYCTLFTDATNPTSNSVYIKIGYEPVASFEHLRFSM
jgi:predicted GNAT family acetyltransferase